MGIVDRRKWCEGICSEEYIRTGVPYAERIEIKRQANTITREEYEQYKQEIENEIHI